MRALVSAGLAGMLVLSLAASGCGPSAGPAGRNPAPPEGLVYGAPPYEGLSAAWVARQLAEHAAHGHAAGESEEHEHEHGGAGHHHGRPGGPFSAEQLRRVVELQVARVARRDGGVFLLHDPQTGDDRRLVLVKVLDPVRRIEHLGYFVLAEFEDAGDPDRHVIVDFWLTYPNFKLEISGAAIQAEKRRAEGSWQVDTRYELALDQTKVVDPAAL